MSKKYPQYDWARELEKVGGSWYEDCEKAVFNAKFGVGNWEFVKRREDNDYQGQTKIILKVGDDIWKCNYWWGSCDHCDTLQGGGVEEACDMICGELERLEK